MLRPSTGALTPIGAARLWWRPQRKQRQERHGADQGTSSRQPRARFRRPDGTPLTADRCAVRHRRQRRQGVLLDHRRCRRGARPGSRCASAPRSAVRAVPGVTRRMVALTAERKGGAARAAASGAAPRPAAPRPAHGRGRSGAQAGVPGVDVDHRGRVRQGRRRQIDHRGQSRARAARSLGLKVGMLDADIYGPSLPKLLAIKEKPQTHRRHAAQADRRATASR